MTTKIKALAKATKEEVRRFTRWLYASSNPKHSLPKEKFKISLEFEVAGARPDDLVLLIELCDAVALAATETHDVPAIRLDAIWISQGKLWRQAI